MDSIGRAARYVVARFANPQVRSEHVQIKMHTLADIHVS
jgi:hypothetical protein